MRLSGRLLAAAALAALFPAAAMAALDDIVVTATRYERPVSDLPARVSVLTAADLRRLSIEKIDEALAFVAGVTQSRQNGPYSFQSVASLRGLSTAQQGRTLVLVDGAPVNVSATGGVNWNRIPLELVERIEVFKGPGSSVYGGDAVGGVIHIITRRPRRRLEAAAGGEVASYETDGQRLLASGRSSGTACDLYWRAYGFHGRSLGYVSTPPAQRTAYTVKKHYREGGLGALGGLGWDSGRLEFEYAAYDDARGEGTRIMAPEGQSRTYGIDTFRFSGEGRLGQSDWRVLAYQQRELYGRLNESGSLAAYQRVNTDADRRDSQVSGALSRTLGPGQRLTVGAEAKAGRLSARDRCQTSPYATVVDAGRLESYAVHLQDEISLPEGWPKVLASLRYDEARFHDGLYSNPASPGWAPFNGPLPAQNWGTLTWRGSARQRFTENFSAYLSFSRGFRQPGLEDMALTLARGKGAESRLVQANPNLRPERLDTCEAGSDWEPFAGVKISPSLFYSLGRDFIYSVNTGRTAAIAGYPANMPVYQSQNVASVAVYGAEAEVSCAAGPAALSASYAFARSRVNDCGQNPYINGNDLAYAPRHQAGISAGWRFAWFNASLSWRYKAGQFLDDANTQANPPYSTLAFKIRRRLGWGLSLEAALENALDNRYQESATDMAPGRSGKASLGWEF